MMRAQALSFTAKKHGWEIALLATLGCVFAYLLSRNLGLNPAIFADEWYYSKFARLSPLGEAIIPSYLYLWIFRGTSMCGDGFLDCTRVLNALFFVGAAPFIYLVARRVCGRPLALVVALFSMLAPVNAYTVYFMPESMYYFGFWVLSWAALAGTGWRWPRYALATGAVLGLMSLVKVHALFLLPALCLFTLFVSWNRYRGTGWIRIGLLSVLLSVLTMFAIKFGLGYAIAGESALHLFGSFYSATADNTASRSMTALLAPAFINGRGHLMALALLLALPLALLAQALFSRASRARAGEPLATFQLYTLLMLGAGLGMTVMYTASIAGYGPLEVMRLHLRYYSFVFPLLIMVGAAPLAQGGTRARPLLAWAIALLLAALVLMALVMLPGYSLNPVDGPEIAALDLTSVLGRTVAGLDLLILLLWACNSRLAAPLFMFGALPLILYCGNDSVNAYLAQLVAPWPADKAGKFAHHYLPPHEHKRITVAGSGITHLMRAQFHIDDKEVALLELPDDVPIETYQLPVHNKWLLVVGKHALPAGIKPLAATADYALVALHSSNRSVGALQLADDPIGNALVAGIEGLSHAESWGRWSEGKQVVIHFKAPLPKHLNVILQAQSFGVNATLPFVMHVGSSSRRFRLSSTPQEVNLHFETDGTERSLTIDVPHPISPSELGQPNDVRTLGIGLAGLEIGEEAAP